MFAIAVNTTSRFNTAPSNHERAECSCRSMTLFCTSAHYLSIDGVLFADVQSGLFNINVDKLYLITYYGAIRTPPRGAVWCVRNRFCASGHCPSRWMIIDGCSTPALPQLTHSFARGAQRVCSTAGTAPVSRCSHYSLLCAAFAG
jgi:hypothetical protein